MSLLQVREMDKRLFWLLQPTGWKWSEAWFHSLHVLNMPKYDYPSRHNTSLTTHITRLNFDLLVFWIILCFLKWDCQLFYSHMTYARLQYMYTCTIKFIYLSKLDHLKSLKAAFVTSPEILCCTGHKVTLFVKSLVMWHHVTWLWANQIWDHVQQFMISANRGSRSQVSNLLRLKRKVKKCERFDGHF